MNNVNTYNCSNRNSNNNNSTMAKFRPKQIQKSIDKEEYSLYLVTSIFVAMLLIGLISFIMLIVTFKEVENARGNLQSDNYSSYLNASSSME